MDEWMNERLIEKFPNEGFSAQETDRGEGGECIGQVVAR